MTIQVTGSDIVRPKPQDCVGFLEIDDYPDLVTRQPKTRLKLYVTHKGFYKVCNCIFDQEISGPTEDLLMKAGYPQEAESFFLKVINKTLSSQELELEKEKIKALGITLISAEEMGEPLEDEQNYDVPSDIRDKAYED